MYNLAEVAARTDDRMLLLETVSEARDAYSNGSPAVRRDAAGVLGRVAWQRDDVHEAARWLGGEISLLVTPFVPTVLDQLTLTARVASAAGDAGLRARLLDAVDVLERQRPGGSVVRRQSPNTPAGYSSVMPMRWRRSAARSNRLRGRFFTQALPRTPAAS